MSFTPAAPADSELAVSDLGPLAWVLDELRKSLDGATKAMRRFVRDAELARGSDLTELDASHLRIARQQLHQAVGALEMVGLVAPAKVLRAMETLAQKFVQRPELCSDDAANCMERGSFALTEYLEGVLKGKSASSVALFPQYRALQELAGADRIHPADLWPPEWRWLPVSVPVEAEARAYGADVRRDMDHAVLRLVKYADTKAARRLQAISVGLAAGCKDLESRTFWMVSAAYFESTALGLFAGDVYSKRAASRVLQQYVILAKGEPTPSDRLAQDLVFFCSLAIPAVPSDAPLLSAVKLAYGLSRSKPVDYTNEQFGRFDPALLVLARKRIATAAETWSALAGGDTNRLKVVLEQFTVVAEAVTKLHPESAELARALMGAIDATVRSGAAPAPSVAMEVATAVLYLEAAYEDLDPTDSQMADRSVRLAQRLAHVTGGAEPEPLEAWIEELYRRVSDRQTMGSVVDELRTNLGEVEKSLDQFFRNPKDKSPLREVPSQLAQMRGVFSVLGLDQPSIAALRMRSSVEQFLVDEIDEEAARTGIFEKLGNSLGAMGFLIDMLSYQRSLAKTLFVYDDATGEFRPLMGRERVEAQTQTPTPTEVPSASVVSEIAPAPLASSPAVMPITTPTAAVEADADDGAELRDIFLEEAREVVQNGLAALQALRAEPTNLADQTTLRRAFHTLKGSSRMVGLNEFGEAGWAFEQLLNTSLAEQRPASEALIDVSGQAMQAFERWVEDIAAGQDAAWSAQSFRQTADALRLQGQSLALLTPPKLDAAVADLPVVEVDAPLASVGAALDINDDAATVESDAHTTDVDEVELIDAIEPELTPVLDPWEQKAPVDFESTQMFDGLDTPSAMEELAPPAPPVDFAATQMVSFESTQIQDLSALSVGDTDLNDLDLGDFDFATTAEALPPSPSAEAHSDALELSDASADEALALALDFPEYSRDAVAPDTHLQSVDAGQATESTESSDADDDTKVIGDLRLSIPLYNVYLNEADEWSRRLQTELSEWALELPSEIADSVVSLAHSLLGSSATVGFSALSNMARALEQALQHVQLHHQGTPEQAQVFNNAAEDIRRLLHQFAAGFLKEADPSILQALQAITETEFAGPAWDAEPSQSEVVDAVDSVVDSEIELAPEPALPHDLVPTMASAAPLTIADAQDDDIDAQDYLDEDLLPIFQEEAQELMPQLGTALRQWVAYPDNLSARNEILRLLHTLKGSARLAGAMRLGEMAHRMESSIEQIGTEALQSIQLEPLLTRFDTLQSAFAGLGVTPELAESEATALPTKSLVPATELAVTPLDLKSVVHVPAMPVAPRAVANHSVRVRSQLLDRLVNQAGEVMITRSRMDARLTQLRSSLGELGGNLDRLRQQLRDVELQAESQMQSRLAQAKDSAQSFDPLEFDRFTRVQELTRMMAESVNDVATVQRNLQRSVESTEDDLIAQGRQARELQRDLLRTRMVEFEGISDRLYGVVRQAAKDAGKQVKLDITGGSIEMDRGVLDRMAPAFEHLLRNAVAHGIESADVRLAAGKPPAGAITIHVSQESNDVSVSFQDDGGGLHAERIRQKAIANGVIGADDALSDAEAANLIFMPGFSTAESITELAGRGIGMDVVRSEVNALGGRIETQTTEGQGTKFSLVLPLTTAVTQVVILRMGEFTIGVPANIMETVLRVPVDTVAHAYSNRSFDMAGQALPFFWAGALLQVSARSVESGTKTLPVAVFRSAGQRLALHVDEVLGNREVVVKNLGPQLARLPGLAGMSVLASGAVVLIYNPVALAAVYGDMARTLTDSVGTAGHSTADGAHPQPKLVEVADQLPLVLVVDDSITVRRVTQRLLKREGYRVALANDGLQALERLQEELPSVVLSDIEMPRMDGFDLLRNIRGHDRTRALPVIMITSRIAEKHREHARELGADHYLGKPYSEDELLALVRSYTTEVQAAF
jgi:chemosensory pili system protein ChpA (sensor histidine kinase/response regulator)